MGDLFELLFSNFLIVAAVIGGIISFFSRMGNDQEDERKHKSAWTIQVSKRTF